MTRNKKLVGAVSGLLVLAGLAGGLGWWHSRHHDNVSFGAASTVVSSSPQAGSAAGTLSIGSGNASNLGQLNGNTNQNGTGGSSSSDSPQAPDPSTFSQYDKYQDSQNALFGDIQVGNGDELAANKKAAVYYKGWLTNGQLFDQSQTGSDGKLQPFVFTMGAHQVIPGWEQALAGMKVGSSRLIIVPPAVGYGAQGQGSVPPNAVMVFEVQLLAVQ